MVPVTELKSEITKFIQREIKKRQTSLIDSVHMTSIETDIPNDGQLSANSFSVCG